MGKYKVSWFDENENVWKYEVVKAKWYDDAFRVVEQRGIFCSICEPVY